MRKPPTSKIVIPLAGLSEESEAGQHDVLEMVEGLLEVLGRNQADPTDGVLSLLTAFTQGAQRVLELSAPEDIEHNRSTLLGLLEHVRREIDTWPQAHAHGWRVH